MAGGIEGDGHEFGLRPADLHPHNVGFFPHNFDQVFIHVCFELHDEYFKEYPRSRGMVTSRNIPARVPFKWLKAIYGKRRT